jgi:hypothetical protein
VLLGIEIPSVLMLAKSHYLHVGQAPAEPSTNVALLVTPMLCLFGIERSPLAKRGPLVFERQLHKAIAVVCITWGDAHVELARIPVAAFFDNLT